MTALLWGPPCVEAWVRKGDMGASLVAQDDKETVCNAGDLGLIPRLGRSLGWRREWLLTPVFLPGEFHGQRRLAGYSPWGCKKPDTTELLILTN